MEDKQAELEYRNFFQLRVFSIVPVSVTLADQAAALCARYNLRTPDGIHLATALASGCNTFLTNDSVFRRVAEPNIIFIDDLFPTS